MDDDILKLMHLAVDVARRARENGNHPFGALLVDQQGNILLQAENTVVTERDCTGHAETNLMRMASRRYDPAFLATCTLYTSTEPCPMCAGAIYWGNVRRVVYGLGEARFYEMIGDDDDEMLHMPCRAILGEGRKQIEVIGPILEDEALKVHEGFWS